MEMLGICLDKIKSSPKKGTYVVKHESDSDAQKKTERGLSMVMATFFMFGQTTGSGVLAIPAAIGTAGWSGFAIFVVMLIINLYAGICLGKCWNILEERYDEYKADKNRYPYLAIAQVVSGKKMGYLVSFCNDFTLFGGSIVYLLLASEMIGALAAKWGISFCYWILILSLILIPLMWLGTPEDFWPVAVLAIVTSVVAIVLLFVALLKADNEPKPVEYPPPTALGLFGPFGTLIFVLGGGCIFPTIQNDMNDRKQFTAAAILGYGALLILFLPVAVLGYVTYGGGTDKNGKPYLQDNIIQSLPDTYMKTAIEILLAIHLIFALLILINAPAQEFEEFFKFPKSFGWKRCLLRSGIMVLVVFIAESLPRFGKVLDFVGASTLTITSIILPCYFYIKLCARSTENSNWPQRCISLPEKIVLYLIMIVGIIGGIVSTYTATTEIILPRSFNPPCYVNITAASVQ